MANKWLGRIPASEYHADRFGSVPTLSASCAATIANDCLARAYHEHPRLGAASRESSKEQDEGTLIHAVLLGTMEPGQFVGIEANDWRTKAAKEARDAAQADGKIPFLMRQYERIVNACDRIRDALLREGIDFSECMTEHAALWEARATNGATVQCRSMLDAFNPADMMVTDLKSTDSAHPRAFRASVERYGYDIQAHAYRLAVDACMPDFVGRTRFQWAVVETKAPYVVAVYQPAGSMRELGRVKWEQAVDKWEHALRADRWTGYVDGVGLIEASPWSITEAVAEGGSYDENV